MIITLIKLSLMLYLLASLVGIVFHKEYRKALNISAVFSLLASMILLISSVMFLSTSSQLIIFDVLGLPIFIDQLSSFMLAVLGILGISTAFYFPRYMERYIRLGHGWLYGFLHNIFVLSMIMIILSRNMISFIVFWEIMTSISYLLIVWEHDIERTRKAGFRYFIIMHVFSTLPLTLALFIMHYEYHVLDFLELPGKIEEDILLYLLLMIGCGSKTGVFPFHFWMPETQLTAPSGISALISSGMNNVAFYSLMRFLFLYVPHNVVIGYTITILGIITITLCTIFALSQHEYKRILSYYSIGHMGYVWFSIGLSVLFFTMEEPYTILGVLAFMASLYQLLNNAIFKASLFLSAGSILYKTNTHSILSLKGIAKTMPFTSLSILIASLSMAGVPPFSGFFSKWLIYLITILSGKHLIVLAGIITLVTSLVTLFSLIELFTRTMWTELDIKHLFKHSNELPYSMLIGQGLLSMLCLILGLIPMMVIRLLINVSTGVLGINPSTILEVVNLDYYIPVLISPILGNHLSIALARILFSAIIASTVIVSLASSKIAKRIEYEIIEEYMILKKKIASMYQIERKFFHNIIVLFENFFKHLNTVSHRVYEKYIRIEHTINEMLEFVPKALQRSHSLQRAIDNVASSKTSFSIVGASITISRLHVIGNRIVSALVNMYNKTFKNDIYLDELIWRPLIAYIDKFLKNVATKRYELSIYLFLSITFLTILLAIMVLSMIIAYS